VKIIELWFSDYETKQLYVEDCFVFACVHSGFVKIEVAELSLYGSGF
jgi:hypothetical protein